MNQRIYLDCDGVLADFDTGFRRQFKIPPGEAEAKMGEGEFWRAINGIPNFYRELPLMPGAHEIVDGTRHLRPIILTGIPYGGWAESQKVSWAAFHFPDIPMVCCMARNKSNFCAPGDVLIDDRDHYRHLWEARGGIFIHHKSAKQSLAELVHHGIS